MLYICTEDQASGKEFWVAVNDTLWDKQANIFSSNGITELYLAILSKEINENDTLFVAFDRVNNISCKDLLCNIADDALHRKYQLFIPSYYCFEELFLSFEQISAWGQCADIAALEIEKRIDKRLFSIPITDEFLSDYRNSGYYNAEFKQFLSALKRVNNTIPYTLNNREVFAKELLSELTAGGQGKQFLFSLKHRRYKDCWYKNCANIRQKWNHLKFFQSCVINKKIEIGKEKLEYFNNNTLMIYSKY